MSQAFSDENKQSSLEWIPHTSGEFTAESHQWVSVAESPFFN